MNYQQSNESAMIKLYKSGKQSHVNNSFIEVQGQNKYYCENILKQIITHIDHNFSTKEEQIIQRFNNKYGYCQYGLIFFDEDNKAYSFCHVDNKIYSLELPMVIQYLQTKVKIHQQRQRLIELFLREYEISMRQVQSELSLLRQKDKKMKQKKKNKKLEVTSKDRLSNSTILQTVNQSVIYDEGQWQYYDKQKQLQIQQLKDQNHKLNILVQSVTKKSQIMIDDQDHKNELSQKLRQMQIQLKKVMATNLNKDKLLSSWTTQHQQDLKIISNLRSNLTELEKCKQEKKELINKISDFQSKIRQIKKSNIKHEINRNKKQTFDEQIRQKQIKYLQKLKQDFASNNQDPSNHQLILQLQQHITVLRLRVQSKEQELHDSKIKQQLCHKQEESMIKILGVLQIELNKSNQQFQQLLEAYRQLKIFTATVQNKLKTADNQISELKQRQVNINKIGSLQTKIQATISKTITQQSLKNISELENQIKVKDQALIQFSIIKNRQEQQNKAETTNNIKIRQQIKQLSAKQQKLLKELSDSKHLLKEKDKQIKKMVQKYQKQKGQNKGSKDNQNRQAKNKNSLAQLKQQWEKQLLSKLRLDYSLSQKSKTIDDAISEIISIKSKFTSLTVSSILQGKHQQRKMLTQFIQKFTGKQYFKTSFIYYYNTIDKNFFAYLKNEKRAFIILFQLELEDRICGVFSWGLQRKNKQNGDAFMFSLVGKGREFKKRANINEDIAACTLKDNYLTFGNGELKLKNNDNPQFLLMRKNYSDNYFDIDRIQDMVGQQKSPIKYKHMQIHMLQVQESS